MTEHATSAARMAAPRFRMDSRSKMGSTPPGGQPIQWRIDSPTHPSTTRARVAIETGPCLRTAAGGAQIELRPETLFGFAAKSIDLELSQRLRGARRVAIDLGLGLGAAAWHAR